MPAQDKIGVVVDGRELTLTNLGKVLYPEDGFSKAEVLDYYQRISGVLLPHAAGRPMTLKRYPEGVDGESFFQKHAPERRPTWVRTERVESQSSRGRGETIDYVVMDDLPTLMWAANLAALELHVPQWRFPRHDEPAPDLLVFDLDPGAPATVVECCRVAEALRPLLAADGFEPLAKTSGGKGLQLYTKISGVTADEASERAKDYAQRLEHDKPDLVVSKMTKSLRQGKVLIDWSQNNGSKTTVAPYSLRARTHPTVSTPVTWDEVESCRDPGNLFFTAPDVLARVEKSGDLFAPLLLSRGDDPDVVRKPGFVLAHRQVHPAVHGRETPGGNTDIQAGRTGGAALISGRIQPRNGLVPLRACRLRSCHYVGRFLNSGGMRDKCSLAWETRRGSGRNVCRCRPSRPFHRASGGSAVGGTA